LYLKYILHHISFIFHTEQVFIAALAADLGRCEFEAVLGDIELIYSEADLCVAKLREWMRPVVTDVAAFVAPASSQITTEPFGATLILGPFNYPLQLMVGGTCSVSVHRQHRQR
jgi:aldehyde dehydrogenase (NAD+)